MTLFPVRNVHKYESALAKVQVMNNQSRIDNKDKQ